MKDPKPGHGRPGWWWSTFYNDVFIVKGAIESHDVVDTNRSYISTLEVLDALYFLKERADSDHKPPGKYVTGKLKVIEVLLISNAYVKDDSNARDIRAGKDVVLDVFIQAYKITDKYSPGSNIEKEKKEIYLAKYSSKDKPAWFMVTPKVLLGIPTYYISHKISKDDMKQIKDILKFRENNVTLYVKNPEIPYHDKPKSLVEERAEALILEKRRAKFRKNPNAAFDKNPTAP